MAAANNRYAPVGPPGRIADAIRFLGKKIGQQDPGLLHRVYELLPGDAWTAELAVNLAKSASGDQSADLTAIKRLEDVIAITGASCALYLSDIPFMNPIAGVRIGLIEGRYIINPTYDEVRE